MTIGEPVRTAETDGIAGPARTDGWPSSVFWWTEESLPGGPAGIEGVRIEGIEPIVGAKPGA